ncbi:MAG: hypothetical protein U9Q62_08715 [Campylobacterota bacterium]|nr:hypothetical protein [Campylobacterota bacterium]
MNTFSPLKLIFLLIIAMISFSGCEQKEKSTPEVSCAPDLKVVTEKSSKEELTEIKRQLSQAGTVQCCEEYIVRVILEGSDILKMPAGRMAEGYAHKGDAEKIAAYVITLSNRKPTHPEYVGEGNLYYDGNCAGCHGTDGKGLGGSHPDLTLNPFKGAVLRKKALLQKLKKLEQAVADKAN